MDKVNQLVKKMAENAKKNKKNNDLYLDLRTLSSEKFSEIIETSASIN